jgi:hypothetical protein
VRAVSARCAGVVTTGAHCWRTSVLASGFSEPGAVADALSCFNSPTTTSEPEVA